MIEMHPVNAIPIPSGVSKSDEISVSLICKDVLKEFTAFKDVCRD
jgi:hypothetical protein